MPAAFIPLGAAVVLISTVAPSTVKWPELGITIAYPVVPPLLSFIVSLVFTPETVICPFMYISPKVPFPLFSRVT